MTITSSNLPGVFEVHLQPNRDHRGYFMRTYCEDTFGRHGLNQRWLQCSQTLTRRQGALRGLHWQADPAPEIKLVRCLRGRVWDVVADIRPDSPTFGQWQAFELGGDSPMALYIPAGFAHGFQCLEEDCELFYMISAAYQSDLARGVRWNDPQLAIPWPLPVCDLSERDTHLPRLSELS